MRIATFDQRAVIVTDEGLIDVADASAGRFSSSTDDLVGRLDELGEWFAASGVEPTWDLDPDVVARDPRLGPVVSRPSQIFGIGLNYRRHAIEMGMTPPTTPLVFTKFASSLAGATASVTLPSTHTDWEAELVVVIGARARHVAARDALRYVAGYCVGQDFSDRDLQMSGTPPQFSLGKSHENFSPIGPWLTTPDECANPDDLRITCDVNDVRYQDSSTEDMVTNVAGLIAYLSSVCEIRAGDVIFTGSPAGVGQGHTPPVFLTPGDVVTSTILGLGSLRNVTSNATR